jgi:hypothetical protein
VPDPLIPDYETPEAERPVPPPAPPVVPAADVPGFLSLVLFGGVLLCFCVGLAGLLFDPRAKEDQGGGGYLIFMALPVVVACPLGLILGLLGLRDGPARLSAIGVVCNGAALLLFVLWIAG